MNSTHKLIMVLSFALALVLASLSGAGAEDFSDFVDEKGKISNPGDIRTAWSHLGSWIVPRKSDDQYGFHDVYARQSTIDAYQKTGQFPDGAILLREIRNVDSASLPTGKTFWAGELQSWFVMVKDQRGRFPDNPHWGDGWGWAHFEPENPEVNVSQGYKQDCLDCHVSARGTDYVNVRGYPPLR